VNIDDARRKNLTKEEYSDQVADLWRAGLESWGIGERRIRDLSEAVDYTIYTPGSSTGIPINILSSLDAPKSSDRDSLNNLITGTTSALLELLKINKDPVMSYEGILLSSLLQHYWSQSESPSLERLIHDVQNPPFNRLGVFDIETVYPEEDRVELALALNSLIASPSFTDWLNGDPLDISKILFQENGKPRHSVFSLAHLGDEERMFFVTLLLERISTWMQSQSGTTSLRTILYFDEVFGYMPPVANPPSKTPLLRLLKQGRAYGIGVVLTTQNPVDLDYKGLTNTGTWFIGKLQTERDKDRVLEGLAGAAQLSNVDTVDYGDIIGKLRSRVFLLHNVHEDSTKIFHTRWAMNYLRGPLTGVQIRKLMEGKKDQVTLEPSTTDDYSDLPPSIDPKIEQYYVQLLGTGGVGQFVDGKIMLYPALLLNYTVRFYNNKRGIDKTVKNWAISPEPNSLGVIDWSQIQVIDPLMIHSQPLYSRGNVVYNQVPSQYNTVKELKEYRDSFSDYLYRSQKYPIGTHQGLKVIQKQGESREDFMVRVRQAAREERDEEIDKLEKKYDSKLDKLNSRIERLTSSIAADEAEYNARKREEVFGVGETVLGLLLGRRRTTGITTASRRRRMTTKAKHEIDETKREIEELKEEITELESELREEVEEITEKWEKVGEEIVDYEVTPRRTDINVNDPMIAWVHYS
jgi:hypothetical protein